MCSNTDLTFCEEDVSHHATILLIKDEYVVHCRNSAEEAAQVSQKHISPDSHTYFPREKK